MRNDNWIFAYVGGNSQNPPNFVPLYKIGSYLYGYECGLVVTTVLKNTCRSMDIYSLGYGFEYAWNKLAWKHRFSRSGDIFLLFCLPTIWNMERFLFHFYQTRDRRAFRLVGIFNCAPKAHFIYKNDAKPPIGTKNCMILHPILQANSHQIIGQDCAKNIGTSVTNDTKVPPSRERRGQRTERHVICKAPEGEPQLSFRRLANPKFRSLIATLSALWDF